MIKENDFSMLAVLDEPIYFKFKYQGVKETIWTNDSTPITFRSFIERHIDDAEIFPQYAELKEDYKKLLLEHEELKKKYEKFRVHQGKGRKPGTYKLNNEQIEEVVKLYRSGISKRQIALKFKVNEKTIRNLLKKFDV